MRRAPIINCIEAPKETQVNTFWHLLLLLFILVFFLSPCFPSENTKKKTRIPLLKRHKLTAPVSIEPTAPGFPEPTLISSKL